MSRITDTERGARIAMDTAKQMRMQPDLFGGTLPEAEWLAIQKIAHAQVKECRWARQVTARA